MSWLSPKRRRTTSNLKTITVQNGQTNEHANGEIGPATPPGSSLKTGSPQSENPPSRIGSQSFSSPSSINSEGNLFYAYARRSDDLRSRYLLTFASATVANEWWDLIQTHFTGSSRPGPQLFSFKKDDLLSQAWKHGAFDHLKTKWMYIQFNDAGSVGGAAQGIIPVQDAHGNLLGGSAPASPEVGQLKKEARAARNELSQLESHFERMMEAVERNTQQIAALADSQAKRDHARSKEETTGKGGYFDASALTEHLGRIGDLLGKNSEHMEGLSQKQFDNEEKLRSALEDSASRQKTEALDMAHLYLDRIQKMMEQSVKERENNEKRIAEQQKLAPQIDLSPLAERLEKIQEAIEQNSTLVKTLLNEGAGTPSEQQPASPLFGHLQRIHSAVENQSSHMQALVGFATGGVEDGSSDSGADEQEPQSVIPLGEHLEQIYNAIEEGTSHVRDLVAETKSSREQHPEMKFDTAPLEKRLDALIEVHRQSLEASHPPVDFSPLVEHLEAIREATEQNAEQLSNLVEAQGVSQEGPSSGVDFTPLTDRLNRIHSTLEMQNEARRESSPSTGDSKFIMSALSSHLSKIQAVTEANAQHVKSLREKQSASQDKMHIAVAQTAEQIRTLSARNAEVEGKLGAGDAQMKELIRTLSTRNAEFETKSGARDAQMRDLIRTLSSRNADVESKLEARDAQMKEMMSGQKEMVQAMRQIAKTSARNVEADGKGTVRDAQMRELMSGQREMVDAVRQLALAITAQQKEACDHVVIPPPRKVGRKVVGFVYDAKDGGA